MGQLGFTEMLVIFIIALLVFGPKKLPELGKSLGKGIREFKKASDELKSSWEEQVKDVQAPLNDVKKDIHEMGKDVQSDFYKSIEPEHSQHPAAETQTAEETHSEPLPDPKSTEPAVPKEHA
jgi:TatA/E family protein of Tat protein translocase